MVCLVLLLAVGGLQAVFLIYVILTTSTLEEQLWAPWYC